MLKNCSTGNVLNVIVFCGLSRFITVNTYAFEALDFYKELGFYLEFEPRNPDNDSIFYFLRKDL